MVLCSRLQIFLSYKYYVVFKLFLSYQLTLSIHGRGLSWISAFSIQKWSQIKADEYSEIPYQIDTDIIWSKLHLLLSQVWPPAVMIGKCKLSGSDISLGPCCGDYPKIQSYLSSRWNSYICSNLINPYTLIYASLQLSESLLQFILTSSTEAGRLLRTLY